MGWEKRTKIYSVQIQFGHKVPVYNGNYTFQNVRASLVGGNPDVPYNTLSGMESLEITKIPPLPPPFTPQFIAIMYSDTGFRGREVLKFSSTGR